MINCAHTLPVIGAPSLLPREGSYPGFCWHRLAPQRPGFIRSKLTGDLAVEPLRPRLLGWPWHFSLWDLSWCSLQPLSQLDDRAQLLPPWWGHHAGLIALQGLLSLAVETCWGAREEIWWALELSCVRRLRADLQNWTRGAKAGVGRVRFSVFKKPCSWTLSH